MGYKGRHLVDGEPRGYRPSDALLAHVRARDGEACQRCGTTTARRYHVAHIVPWPDGPTDASNLRVLCQSCNLRERRGWGVHPRDAAPRLQPKTGDTEVRAVMARVLAL